MDQRCVLCCSKDDDELIFGKVHKKGEVVVHCNCLYLSSNLVQNGNERNGILNFLKEDILKEKQRCHSIRCYYCQRRGANIGCCRSKCRHNFHTKCGYDNLAVSQFNGSYKSYCNLHVPKYRFRPEPKERCMICFESLEGKRKRFSLATTIQSPCCRNGWYHRRCLQKYANSAGYFFKCPLCNDEKKFAEVALFGISIPNCDASWELEPDAFADQFQRPQHCTALKCRVRRSDNRIDDIFDLIYCIMCGSNPVHIQCTKEKSTTYQCADCIVVTPSLASVPTDSDTEVDVFESFVVSHTRRYPAPATRGSNDSPDLRHSKLFASFLHSSESEDDDDDEDEFEKVCKILNESRQQVKSSPGPSSQSSQSPGPSSRERVKSSPGPSSRERAKPSPGTSSQGRAIPEPSSSSSQAAFLARCSRQTLPAKISEQNENAKDKGKAKKRRSSKSPLAPSGSRRLLQPISPMATSSGSNVFGTAPRRRRTMPPSSYDNVQRFNMDESCVANRTRTRLPTYMANKKDKQ